MIALNGQKTGLAISLGHVCNALIPRPRAFPQIISSAGHQAEQVLAAHKADIVATFAVLLMAPMLFLAPVRRHNGHHQVRVIVSTEVDRLHSHIHGLMVSEQVIVRHFS